MKKKYFVLLLTLCVTVFDSNFNYLQAQNETRNQGDRAAAEALKTVLTTYNFYEFSSLLSDNCTLTIAGEGCITGKEGIVSFLQKLSLDDQRPSLFSFLYRNAIATFTTPYNFTTALRIMYWDQLSYNWIDYDMLFRMENGKVADMFLGDYGMCSRSGTFQEDEDLSDELPASEQYYWSHQLPFSIKSFQIDSTNLTAALPNTMPCMECGMKSDALNWYQARRYRFTESKGKPVFSRGKISVCPRCNRLIMYYVESMERGRSKDVPKFSSKDDLAASGCNNPYSQKGLEYLTVVDQISKEWRSDDPIPEALFEQVMAQLDALRLPSNGKLELWMQGAKNKEEEREAMNANYEFRVCVDGKAVPSLYGNVYADTTCMGAWQLFLLANAYHVLPCVWHGGYQHYDYVFCGNDLSEIRELVGRDIQMLIEECTIEPQVDLRKEKVGGAMKYIADIHCCYWNDWEGLARAHYKVIMGEHGDFERVFTVDKTVLHHYNCGIIF